MPSRNEGIDEMIAKTSGWRGETLAALREIVHDADPEIVEEVKWRRPSNPMGSAVFEHDGIVCLGVILKERVRLSFGEGSKLPDPKGLFNAQLNGKSRAIDFYEGADLDRDALVALVRAGIALNAAKPRAGRKKA